MRKSNYPDIWLKKTTSTVLSKIQQLYMFNKLIQSSDTDKTKMNVYWGLKQTYFIFICTNNKDNLLTYAFNIFNPFVQNSLATVVNVIWSFLFVSCFIILSMHGVNSAFWWRIKPFNYVIVFFNENFICPENTLLH